MKMSLLTLPWILLISFIMGFIILDMYLFHKEDKPQGYKDALWWSLFWVGASLAFNLVVYFWKGPGVATQYLTAYIVEKALSVDNLFVFLMIFKAFHIPQKYQHRVLYWGIVGALVLRIIMIFLGASLIEQFKFTVYFFGAFLVFTGFKMLTQNQRKFDFKTSFLARLIQRLIPLTSQFKGHQIFVREGGHLKATPLLLALITIEFSDVIFALDSIPAVLAITTDRFIVFSSNIFAIMGLRSLYFFVAALIHNLRFLDMGLSYVLIFIGCKMLASNHYHIPTLWSLGIIVTVLGAAVLASYLWPDAHSGSARKRS